MKLLLGALEFALEQETIMAVLRIASSVVTDFSPLATPDGAVLSASPTTAAEPSAAGLNIDAVSAIAQKDSSSGSGGGGELLMPMLPNGVSATLAVDVAGISVALTEAGVNVAAVTVSAAHCKVNVSYCRIFFQILGVA